MQWSNWCSKTSAATKKCLIGDEKQLKIYKQTLKVQTKITVKKNMVKLVLQHKQIWTVKTRILALSTKITIVKSWNTWSRFTWEFLMIQNTLRCVWRYKKFGSKLWVSKNDWIRTPKHQQTKCLSAEKLKTKIANKNQNHRQTKYGEIRSAA